MNELYFENVIGIGNLFLDFVFFEFENEPILFTCVDEKKNMYLCLCSEIRYYQKWLITKCSLATLRKLKGEEIDIATALVSSQTVTIITMDIDGNEKSFIVNAEQMDELDLPKKNTFIRCDNAKFENYLWKKEFIESELVINENISSSSKFASKVYEAILGTVTEIIIKGVSESYEFLFEKTLAAFKHTESKETIIERADSYESGQNTNRWIQNTDSLYTSSGSLCHTTSIPIDDDLDDIAA